MEDFLVVDGYNVVNNWDVLKKLKDDNFEHARDKLVSLVANYAGFYGVKATIVFDAYQVKGGIEKKEEINGVSIIYSKEGETADMVIERIISDLARQGIVCVVTSDWIEQQLVLGKGGVRLSAREFWQRIMKCDQEAGDLKKDSVVSGRTIDQLVEEKVRITLEKWRREK